MADPDAVCKNRRTFEDIHDHFNKHKDVILKELNNFETDDYIWFCLVKLIHCDAAYAVNFSNAYCITERNIESEEARFQGIFYFPDVFNVNFVRSFMEKNDRSEEMVSDEQLLAFERLADFLDNHREIMKTVSLAREKGYDKSETNWSAILGIHVLKRLAVSQHITFDYEFNEKTNECPCGCKEILRTGDNSLGNSQVWHGNLDIIIGDIGCATTIKKAEEEESPVKGLDGAFELKQHGKLEEFRNQMIAQDITVTFLRGSGLTPLIGLSHKRMKTFMFDVQTDLLFESSEMPLFDRDVTEFKMTTIVALWFLINYKSFCTGMKKVHKAVGYTADFSSFVKGPVMSVYLNHLQNGGCRHSKRPLKPTIDAADKKGRYKRFKLLDD